MKYLPNFFEKAQVKKNQLVNKYKTNKWNDTSGSRLILVIQIFSFVILAGENIFPLSRPTFQKVQIQMAHHKHSVTFWIRLYTSNRRKFNFKQL
jgi:hypothetical protein